VISYDREKLNRTRSSDVTSRSGRKALEKNKRGRGDIPRDRLAGNYLEGCNNRLSLRRERKEGARRIKKSDSRNLGYVRGKKIVDLCGG